MRNKQRVIAGAGLVAGLVAGGGAGLILGASSGAAGAVGAATSAATAPSTPTTGDSSGSGTASPAAAREQRLRDLLQPLVDNGTITAAQLDAIVAELATADGGRGLGLGGPGQHGGLGRRGHLAVDLDIVAAALGMTPAEVRTALRDGTTLKALAESKGTSAQEVIDALVAAAKARLDQRVADGTLTQAEADSRLAEATTRITDLVNNGSPAGVPGPPRPGHRRGAETSDTTTEDAPTSTPSSTPSTTTG